MLKYHLGELHSTTCELRMLQALTTQLTRRRVCFTQYCATDAWPLIGVVGPEGYGVEGPVDWERFCSTIVRGSPTYYPRMVNIPISLPFPYDRGYDVFIKRKTKSKKQREVLSEEE
ncbi:hypothetical protein OS493_024801 [Desmophyllum pertusum]|uniref:Uncharacterized protein n=1 Tax=Desmophyllum pertusum TaxID=174260 RepID=A0A9W9ZAG4_9CNID|nr:hypothetical protein OS493_024801 [Desmophyllum pertusum]